MQSVNYSNYRESLKHYCDRVNDESEVLIVTRKAGGNVVMLSEGQYNNLMENLYLRSNPGLFVYLMASIDQMKRGAAHTLELHVDEEGEDTEEDE